jgi:hypothetical protein
MKLVEEGALTLDDKVNSYLTSSTLSDAIQIKHLLSHTSQGHIGEQYFYSARFTQLTEVIEKASGQSFKTYLNNEIVVPLGLDHTFLLEDIFQLGRRNELIAAPYILQSNIERGFINTGYSASAGIISTPADLLRFSNALEDNEIISEASKEKIYTGLDNGLPYAFGIFNQEVEGTEVLWVYGQYDCYSSLLVKVPSRDLTLVLLANNKLMSDPARLLMGDISSSLFALSFLKNYVFDLAEMPLIEEPESVYSATYPEDFYRRKVLAQALAESFLAPFEPQKREISAELLTKTFEKYPDYLSYANINLLHTLSFLKDATFYMNLGTFNTFDKQLSAIGEKLLTQEPNNPYLHAYLGTYYDRLGNTEKARFHFQSIIDLDNFSPSWYTDEAKYWLLAHE